MYTATLNPQAVQFKGSFNQPRNSHYLLQNLITDMEFLKDFEKRPLEILKSFGVDTSEVKIPDNFKLPPQDILKERLKYYYDNEEFVSPAQHASAAGFWFVLFLVPVFAY
ncbi:hypothetical protein EIB75_09885 [Epilithonimonas vandammei]|uniref:Uncharacterized protein n=1 Tax=Epilithonimonas vandammei TaxID=2487072 RepID=A0A3G8ZDT8_9FLAO|nr:hypothetical protein [Epilithonimonas vandammei]AZI55539.1 hypothetical protein EIB75_09885 [Epilithonimonas vandammei]